MGGTTVSAPGALIADVNAAGGPTTIRFTTDPATFAGLPSTDFDGGVRWEFDVRLLWDATPGAVEYHVYRDAISNLSFATFAVCRDDLDAARTDTQLDDFSAPAPGSST